MSDPSKAASPATQHVVRAVMWLLFAVAFFFSHGKFLLWAIPVSMALVYLGLSRRATRGQKRPASH
jgi:hypothetical protein